MGEDDRERRLQEAIDLVCAVPLAPAHVERLAEKIAPRLPPRDREHQVRLAREFVATYLSHCESGNEQFAEFFRMIALFRGGADGRKALQKTCCPFTDRRRQLLWGICRYGRTPGRTFFFDRVLESEQ